MLACSEKFATDRYICPAVHIIQGHELVVDGFLLDAIVVFALMLSLSCACAVVINLAVINCHIQSKCSGITKL